MKSPRHSSRPISFSCRSNVRQFSRLSPPRHESPTLASVAAGVVGLTLCAALVLVVLAM